MSGVVVRCPNCGTTQAALGECEACHEAETRYFCPNHTPGLWLDAPACASCGARVGVAPPAAKKPAPRSGEGGRRPPRATPPRDTPPPREAPPSRRRRPREEPRPASPEEVWSGDVRTPERGEFDLFDVLEEMTAARTRGGRSVEAPLPPPPPVLEVPRAVSSAFGCLRRLVVIAVILIVLAVLAMFAFFELFGVGGPLNRATAAATAAPAAPSAAPPLVVARVPAAHFA